MHSFKHIKLNTSGFSHNFAMALAAVLVGIAGSVYLVISHAATAPNCSVLRVPDHSVQLCANINSNNLLNAAATYTGRSATDTFRMARTSLYRCTASATPVCVVVVSSNTFPAPVSGQRHTTQKTPNVAFISTSVYKACVSFTSSTGWQATNFCTSVVSFGQGYGDVVTVYSPPSQPITQQTTSLLNCGNEPLAAKPDGTTWACSFDDEFNGTTLDRSLWTPQTTAASGFATVDTKDGNARACFMDNPHNISVGNGYLDLTAYQEVAPFTCLRHDANFVTPYTSGEIITLNKFSQQYGRFEVRAKLPSTTLKGLQETFWLWPNNDVKYGAWPGSGEIDFAEFYSKYANFTVPYIHYLYSLSTLNFTTHTNTNTPVYGYDSNFNNCYLQPGAFNTYSAVWQSGFIELDVNGKPCVVDHYTSSTGANPAPFDQPFFLALTQGLGIWPVNAAGTHIMNQDNAFVPGTTPLPAITQVDYVRVWK